METLSNQKPEATVNSGVVERLVGISLEEGDYAAIQSTKQDLARVSSYLLEQYARGGVMVPAIKVRYLSDLCKAPIVSSSDILDVVENVVKRKTTNGTLEVTSRVDPAFVEPLERAALTRGRTIESIVQDALDIVLTNSWVEEITPEGGTVYLSRSARQDLESIIGPNFSGQSLVDWAKEISNKVVQRKQTETVQLPAKGATQK